MTMQATTWAWSLRTVSGEEKLVLLALAEYTGGGDDPRLCTPDLLAVERMTGVDVLRCIRRLMDAGVLARGPRHGTWEMNTGEVGS